MRRFASIALFLIPRRLPLIFASFCVGLAIIGSYAQNLPRKKTTNKRADPCRLGNILVTPGDLRPTGTPGLYAFTPLITLDTGLAARIDAEIIDADAAASPGGCGGPNGPVFGYIDSAGPIQNMQAPFLIAPPYSFGCRYIGAGIALSQTPMPLKLAFPRPVGGTCTEYLHFDLRIKVTGADCRTAESTMRLFYLRHAPPANGIEPTPTPITDLQFPGGGIR